MGIAIYAGVPWVHPQHRSLGFIRLASVDHEPTSRGGITNQSAQSPRRRSSRTKQTHHRFIVVFHGLCYAVMVLLDVDDSADKYRSVQATPHAKRGSTTTSSVGKFQPQHLHTSSNPPSSPSKLSPVQGQSQSPSSLPHLTSIPTSLTAPSLSCLPASIFISASPDIAYCVHQPSSLPITYITPIAHPLPWLLPDPGNIHPSYSRKKYYVSLMNS